MSQSPGSLPPADDLQFNTVEPAVGTAQETTTTVAPLTCAFCRQPLTDVYYAVTDKVACPSCFAQVMSITNNDSPAKFAAGAAMGLAGGLVGAVAWFAIRFWLRYEISLVAIAVGYLVARGIRKGSGSLGGLNYQILAVVLTYLCIAANYAADIPIRWYELKASGHMTHPLTHYIVPTIRYSLTHPFTRATSHPIGILIIGIGLYQAWRMTARARLPITGPYQVATGPLASVNRGFEVGLAPQPIADPTPDQEGKR